MWLLKKMKQGNLDRAGGASSTSSSDAPRDLTRGGRHSRGGGASPSQEWWDAEDVLGADSREFAAHNLKDQPRTAGRRYRNFRKIGKGSYGIVFEARDVASSSSAASAGRSARDPSGSDLMVAGERGAAAASASKSASSSATAAGPTALVAVKYIEDVFYSPSEAKKVLRELSLMRQLAHPNIVRMFASLQPPDERHFRNLWIVLEHGGITLKEWVRSPYNRPLAQASVRSVVRQMMEGLKHMHLRCVVHRDIKPSNILIKPTRGAWTDALSRATRAGRGAAVSPWNADAPLHVTIIDFGLARTIEGEEESDSSPLTPGSMSSVSSSGDQSRRGSGTQIRARFGRSAANSDAARLVASDRSDAASSSKRETYARPSLKRQLTKHVVTRWYRPPELILAARSVRAEVKSEEVLVFLQLLVAHTHTPLTSRPLPLLLPSPLLSLSLSPQYGPAVDVWSVGCIMAELLAACNSAASLKVPPIFPGKHCNPLSPNPRDPLTRPKTELGRIDRDHQLSKIFSVLGPPSIGEVERMGRESQLTDCAERLLEHVTPRARGVPPPRPSWNALLTHAPGSAAALNLRAALDVVTQTLRFDHLKRASLEDILGMEFFRDGAPSSDSAGAVAPRTPREYAAAGAGAGDDADTAPRDLARRLMDLALVEPLSPVDLSYVESVNVERGAPRSIQLESRRILHSRILQEAKLVAEQQSAIGGR